MTFRGQAQELEAEAKRKLISRYGKTRQGVVEKEIFIMPTFPPTSSISNVSTSPYAFIEHFVSALGKKFYESQETTQELLLGINEYL